MGSRTGVTWSTIQRATARILTEKNIKSWERRSTDGTHRIRYSTAPVIAGEQQQSTHRQDGKSVGDSVTMATDTSPLLPVTPRRSQRAGWQGSSPASSSSSLPSITSLEETPARPIAGRGVAVDIDIADEYEPSIESDTGGNRNARWAVKLLALITVGRLQT
jgi:hypothetical protein